MSNSGQMHWKNWYIQFIFFLFLFRFIAVYTFNWIGFCVIDSFEGERKKQMFYLCQFIRFITNKLFDVYFFFSFLLSNEFQFRDSFCICLLLNVHHAIWSVWNKVALDRIRFDIWWRYELLKLCPMWFSVNASEYWCGIATYAVI